MQNSSCLPSLWRICKWRLLKKHVTSSVDCISAISLTHYELLALITHNKNTLLLSCFPAFFITTSLSPPPSPLSVPYIPKKHVTNLVDCQRYAQITLITQHKLLASFEHMTQKKKQTQCLLPLSYQENNEMLRWGIGISPDIIFPRTICLIKRNSL